jgi:acyl-CoA synthetase (AMP-forming)/AMP-acid ligase II
LLIADKRTVAAMKAENLRTLSQEDFVFKGVSSDVDLDLDGPIDIDISNLIYTSGSTGFPKGVILTHNNCIRGGEIVSSYLKLKNSDRLASILPLSFDYGMNQILSAVTVGASVVLVASTLAADIVKDLQNHNATVLAMVPLLWSQIANCLDQSALKLNEIRLITNSGGMVPKTLLRTSGNLFPNAEVILMYGLTEAFRATYLPAHLFKEKMGSIGRSIPNNEVFVINDTGECANDEVGELVQRGCLLSKGYWRNEAATREKFKVCPQLKEKLGDEVVVYSGDFVRRDKDGIHWFVGRRDEMIKHNGYRISPEEVENLCTKFPGVLAAVAFGTIRGDQETILVVELQLSASTIFSKDEFIRFCSKEMPSYMIPGEVRTRTEDFPKTSSGKIDRPTIKKLYKEEHGTQNNFE